MSSVVSSMSFIKVLNGNLRFLKSLKFKISLVLDIIEKSFEINIRRNLENNFIDNFIFRFLVWNRSQGFYSLYYFFFVFRDPSVSKSVERIFKIWEDRNVYPEEMIVALREALSKCLFSLLKENFESVFTIT